MSEVSASSAAKIIGVDRSTIRRYIHRGTLKARRAGLRNIVHIEVNELRRFATEQEFRFNEELATLLAED